jgi:hypothetical protein
VVTAWVRFWQTPSLNEKTVTTTFRSVIAFEHGAFPRKLGLRLFESPVYAFAAVKIIEGQSTESRRKQHAERGEVHRSVPFRVELQKKPQGYQCFCGGREADVPRIAELFTFLHEGLLSSGAGRASAVCAKIFSWLTDLSSADSLPGLQGNPKSDDRCPDYRSTCFRRNDTSVPVLEDRF